MRVSRITAGIGALAALSACTSGGQQSRPNIVFFFADDIGTECFGCYGGVEYETPHIDSLARQGIQYMNMNAQPLSSPTRVQVMTGQYNDRNYVAFGYMNQDEQSFARLAKDAGCQIVLSTIRNSDHIFRRAFTFRPIHIHVDILGVIPAEVVKAEKSNELSDRAYAVINEFLTIHPADDYKLGKEG